MNKIRVYIYGAGAQYRKWQEHQFEWKERIEVLGIVTTSDIGVSELDGYPVIRPTEMKTDGSDYVIIAVKEWEEIAKYLIECGVEKEKIIRSSVLYRI